MPKNVKGTVYVDGGPVNSLPDPTAEIDTIKKLAEETNTLVYELSSAFPFQIFPDKIIIDKNKVTIVRKELFFKRISPLLFEDIQTVRVNRGILFAAIEFEVRGYESNPMPITHLWPKEAEKAANYILGMIKTNRDNIDLSNVSGRSVRKEVGPIGAAKENVRNLF